MGQRYPICNANDVIRVLRRNGFARRGRRAVIRNERADGRQVIVADHGNQSIPIGTLKSIIDGAKLSLEDFR
jgi:predicted RNA binding protein YcfA (HicA-like mRNA interferase family)